MRGLLALLQLGIGPVFAAGDLIIFSSLWRITEPIWGAKFFLWWGFLFAGPLGLVVGAVLTLSRKRGKSGPLLTLLSSAVLTCWAIGILIDLPSDLAKRTPNLSSLVIVAAIVLMAITSDLAAYKIYKIAVRETQEI